MQTEKVAGRIVTMGMEEVIAFHNSLPRIMQEKFDKKSAYRIGKLQRTVASFVRIVDNDNRALFELYGKKDEKEISSYPSPEQNLSVRRTKQTRHLIRGSQTIRP